MIARRVARGLVGAALIAAGCVEGDAPRSALAPPGAGPAAVSRTPERRPEPVPAVTELTTTIHENPDPDRRREALYTLADAGGPDGAAVIGQALTDPDARVREAAVEAMTGIEDGTAADWLSIALGDPDPRVRRTAVEALGQVGGVSAKFLLQQALADADAGVREAALQMLAEPAFAGPAVSSASPSG